MIQDAVAELRGIGAKLTEALSIEQLQRVQRCLEAIRQPLSDDDIEALVGLLPEEDESASGLNWTLLHILEAAPGWPRWDLLRNARGWWMCQLQQRLANAGVSPPWEDRSARH